VAAAGPAAARTAVEVVLPGNVVAEHTGPKLPIAKQPELNSQSLLQERLMVQQYLRHLADTGCACGARGGATVVSGGCRILGSDIGGGTESDREGASDSGESSGSCSGDDLVLRSLRSVVGCFERLLEGLDGTSDAALSLPLLVLDATEALGIVTWLRPNVAIQW
jgi:hypothetical protein